MLCKVENGTAFFIIRAAQIKKTIDVLVKVHIFF